MRADRTVADDGERTEDVILIDPLVEYSLAATRGLPSRAWCHMVSDTSEAELHAFAKRLGCRRAWFQLRPAHYDLTPTRRLLAVRLGASEVTSRELVVRNYDRRR